MEEASGGQLSVEDSKSGSDTLPVNGSGNKDNNGNGKGNGNNLR